MSSRVISIILVVIGIMGLSIVLTTTGKQAGAAYLCGALTGVGLAVFTRKDPQ